MKRILVCDDDHEIVQAICVYLTDAGFEIVQAYSGKEALQCVLDPDQQIDLIIMDVMMPEVNGIEATKKIRELYNIPIIMLSAKSEDEDKITGLKIGADDYMTKPFNPEELVARVESQLRRIEMIREGKNKRSNVIRIGGLEVDESESDVTVDGRKVRLTPIEHRILLLERPTHRQNYMKIFGERFRSTPKILWLFIFVIYVKRLRSIPRIHVMSK